jgi:hypothetical protein
MAAFARTTRLYDQRRRIATRSGAERVRYERKPGGA